MCVPRLRACSSPDRGRPFDPERCTAVAGTPASGVRAVSVSGLAVHTRYAAGRPSQAHTWAHLHGPCRIWTLRVPRHGTTPARRYGHRSDGLIHLVMVKKCSRLQYLRFLLTLSSTGAGSAADRPVCPGPHCLVNTAFLCVNQAPAPRDVTLPMVKCKHVSRARQRSCSRWPRALPRFSRLKLTATPCALRMQAWLRASTASSRWCLRWRYMWSRWAARRAGGTPTASCCPATTLLASRDGEGPGRCWRGGGAAGGADCRASCLTTPLGLVGCV